MNQNTFLIITMTLLIGGIGGFLISEMNKGERESFNCPLMSGYEESNQKIHDMHSGVMDHSMMMVASEREFVAGMIPHHQEAVDTATEVLERGGTTEGIRTLAEEIITAQETEIAMLKEWHLSWYGEEYQDGASYKNMMRDLSGLNGEELDKRFLEDMIPHHMGAIMMAQSVRPYIEHQEVSEMADAIMETQMAEIELMREMLERF